MSLIDSNMDIREKAYRFCREYLSGAWKLIQSDEMDFQPISGGLSNLLYLCSLPKGVDPVGPEPYKALLRLHGQPNSSHPETMLTDTVVFTLLSERNLGPKLFGVFPGGRLEEYIPARCLVTRELKDPKLSKEIAQKLAKIHSLEVPIKKSSKWLFSTMDRWLDCVKENLHAGTASLEHLPKIEKLMSMALEQELEWLKKTLLRVGSPIVFCHNDLQEGNILHHQENNNELVFIDFEYCSYNYRGHDFANHFCEWCLDYTVTTPPYFAANFQDFPSKEQQLTFIRAYIEGLPQDQETRCDNNNQESLEERIYHEAFVFVLASNFLWGLWSVINAQTATINFGYWDYAVSRFDAYFQHKRKVVRELNRRKSSRGSIENFEVSAWLGP